MSYSCTSKVNLQCELLQHSEVGMSNFIKLDWSLVPGPRGLPQPAFPSDHVVDGIAEIEPWKIAKVFGELEEVSIANNGNGDWWTWKATYESKDDIFEIGMSLSEVSSTTWGGSPLIGISKPGDALALLGKLREQIEGVYLHSSEAMLYSPEGFYDLFMNS